MGDAYQPIMDATQGYAQIAQYMNPYQQLFKLRFNRAYDIQDAQAGLQAVGQPGGPSAFGGSRAAIQQAEIGRNRASALAQAQAQNFLAGTAGARRTRPRYRQRAMRLGTLGSCVRLAMGELAQKQGSWTLRHSLILVSSSRVSSRQRLKPSVKERFGAVV